MLNSENTLVDSLISGPATVVIKEYLSKGEAVLRKKHLKEKTGAEICRSYTSLIDDLLKSIFTVKSSDVKCAESVALAAIGGYGRGELNIRSDIDLMLLYRKRITPSIEELTEKMLYILWDTGLDLGFSIRSVDECISLAKDDLKTMTSLLDLRFLIGDRELFDILNESVRKDLFNRKRARAFIDEKISESRSRHQKYGGSVYILEPNVKEGEGGLRDIHTALWAIKARNARHLEPYSLGLISERGRSELEGSLDFILWVRNELHFHTMRKTDQLTFDHQERIAKLLGYGDTEHVLAVEAFMQRYYKHATGVNHYSNLMLSRCLHRDENKRKPFFWPKKRVKIDKNYTIADNVLTVRDRDAFSREPEAIIKAFEYSQAFKAEIDQDTKDLILSRLDHARTEDFASEDVSASFIKILKGKDIYRTLSEMYKLKFLEKYIPEFSEIVCRVQHDLYHVYTVDAHTLFAIREIERLRGPYKAEFSLLSTIFEELSNPEVLMLAVLFHDIGKGRGKGHAEKGAAIVPGICKRLGLSEDNTNLIRFLVRNHLLLADTAQYRDLHDENLIIEFAKKVGDTERLNLLYLLTFADVRAVGPDVWSQWKGALFQELYFKTLTVLDRGSFEAEDATAKVLRIKESVVELLKPFGIERSSVDEYFKLLPQRYFLSNGPDFIAEHINILKEFAGKPYVMKVRQDSFREYTEISVCTHDAHGLFSMITGVMAANAVNILGAQINTLKNGIVLDVLQVNSAVGELITDESRLRKIESDLSDVITGKVKVETLVRKRKPSILDKKAKPGVRTNVQIDNEVSDFYTVLDIHAQNRIGLLYDITSTLSRLGLYIYIAKISTKGDEAADIFYVKDIFGQKIYYKEKIKEIIDTLSSVVESKEALKQA